MTKMQPATQSDRPKTRAGPPSGVLPPSAPNAPPSGAQAIIEAAFEDFIDAGFAATRLDDVARRAGVAKGTIYLHFKDKEALFEELVRTAIVPLVGRLDGAAARDGFDRCATCSKALPQTFVQRGRDHPARRHRAADHRGGAALSRDR